MDEILPGGVANAGGVVRQGEFVLRPSNPHSGAIHAFLRDLRSTGFSGTSMPVEIQPDGRERLLFIEGDVPVPPFPSWAQTDDALASIAVLFRSFHDASSQVPLRSLSWSDELADPAGGSMVRHNDLCLENVVFRDGRAIGLLDFDFAAPERPIFDFAAFARMCVPIDDDLSAARLGFEEPNRPNRLRLVADAYGLGNKPRNLLIELLEWSMKTGGSFVGQRVAAGDSNFMRMLAALGGMERSDRRLRWWQAPKQRLVRTLT